MPEMPEVEIIRRSLVDKISNQQITDMEVLLPRLVKWPAPTAFQAMMIGRTVSATRRRGKYLLIEMDNEVVLVIHLRMTGRLRYAARDAARDPYTRIVFHLGNGDVLVYADTRTLGTLYALQKDEVWRVSGLANMGPEPLSADFTVEYLRQAAAKSKGKIKSFLLNQKQVAGLGNIYVDESLIIAGIHPERAACSLTDLETALLYRAINQVIADGIRDGGTTFRDYRDGNGDKGKHQRNLLAYGRGGLPCLSCGTPIEKIEVGGRGTHFCPQCQR